MPCQTHVMIGARPRSSRLLTARWPLTKAEDTRVCRVASSSDDNQRREPAPPSDLVERPFVASAPTVSGADLTMLRLTRLDLAAFIIDVSRGDR